MPLPKKLIVIGGGNVAIDVALTALRKGAEDVTLVCLEKREEMPAWKYEIDEALEEGVKIVNSWGPKRFVEKGGKIAGIEFKRCTSVFDEKGAFNPSYDEKVLTVMDTEGAIVAIGQAGDLSFAQSENVAVTKRGGLESDPVTLQTPLGWVFAGGDALYGTKSVVEAVACGKDAAESINRYINGRDLRIDRNQDWSHEKPDITGVAKEKRISMRKISPSVSSPATIGFISGRFSRRSEQSGCTLRLIRHRSVDGNNWVHGIHVCASISTARCYNSQKIATEAP